MAGKAAKRIYNSARWSGHAALSFFQLTETVCAKVADGELIARLRGSLVRQTAGISVWIGERLVG